MKIISYNIGYGTGMDGSITKYFSYFYRYFKTSKTVIEDILSKLSDESPEILVLSEADNGSFRTDRLNQATYLAKLLKLNYHTSKCKYSGSKFGEFVMKLPYFKHHHAAILSKYPIEGARYHYLPSGLKRLCLEAIISYKGKEISVLSVHLSLGSSSRKEQIKELVSIINRITRPIILAGDFNTTPNSKEIKYLLTNTGLRDAHKIQTNNYAKTFPAINPTKAIDYLLISPKVKIRDAKTPKWQLSDHLPQIADLIFWR